jgi:hypothetical protein
MATTSRHRRPSPVGLLPMIGAALLGSAIGAGAVVLASPSSPTQQVSTSPGPSPNTAPSNTSARAVPLSEGVRPTDPIAFSYQCVFKLPTMDVGRLSFVVGSASITGQAAGD